MARPRRHDPEQLLDHAERLLAAGGPAALTTRALAEASGAPSGTLYHAFGSREALVARVWLRAARRFLAIQRTAVDEALADDAPAPGGASPGGAASGGDAPAGVGAAPGGVAAPRAAAAIAATVAAATTPLTFAATAPEAAAVLLGQRRDVLLRGDLPADVAGPLAALDGELVDLMVRLARALWPGERAGRARVEVVRVCIVDLPTGLVLPYLSRAAAPPPATAQRLRAAVEAVLALESSTKEPT